MENHRRRTRPRRRSAHAAPLRRPDREGAAADFRAPESRDRCQDGQREQARQLINIREAGDVGRTVLAAAARSTREDFLRCFGSSKTRARSRSRQSLPLSMNGASRRRAAHDGMSRPSPIFSRVCRSSTRFANLSSMDGKLGSWTRSLNRASPLCLVSSTAELHGWFAQPAAGQVSRGVIHARNGAHRMSGSAKAAISFPKSRALAGLDGIRRTKISSAPMLKSVPQ